MKDTFWSIAIGLCIVMIIFVLVKPGSQAAAAVAGVSNALAAIIGTATNDFGTGGQ
jgi:preprotein translocase subunit SecG